MARAVTLFNSSFIGSSVGTALVWDGGRGAIHITANQYGGGVFLQSQGPNGRWVSINGTTFSADQVTEYALPAGQVRLISNQGSSINVSAKLLPITYRGG